MMVCSETSEFPQSKPHPCNLVEVLPQRLLLENQLLPTGPIVAGGREVLGSG